MTSLPRDILLIFVSFHACNIPHETKSLRLDPLDVPQVVLAGEEVTLMCPFTLEGERLYSVMWYKDHEEFYRFVPRNNPQKHSYKLDGFNVNTSKSDDQQVLLKDVSLKASGMYRCEVSAEAPSFTSVNAESTLQVISIPEEDPEICGEQTTYNVGDVMALNCTSGKSYPPAQLEWFINDQLELADFEFESPDGSELVSSTTTLILLLLPQHFIGGQMVVRCVASVGPIRTSALISPMLFNHRETSLLVQARGSFATSTKPDKFLSLWLLVLAAIFRRRAVPM